MNNNFKSLDSTELMTIDGGISAGGVATVLALASYGYEFLQGFCEEMERP